MTTQEDNQDIMPLTVKKFISAMDSITEEREELQNIADDFRLDIDVYEYSDYY